MSGRLNFEFTFAKQPSLRRAPDQPLRILLLGNFHGNSQSEVKLEERRIQRIDIDNFDHVLATIAPRLQLQQPDCAIEFSEWDDFHPDQLYRNLSVFEELRTLRKRLRNPETAAQAIAAMAGSNKTAATSDNAPDAAATTEPDSLFEQLMGGSVPGAHAAPNKRGATLVDSFIRDAVAGHIVTAPDTRAYLNAVDLTHTDTLRAILRNPDWQALEANWRGMWWLVSELVTDNDLSLHLLDMDFAELEADLAAAEGDPAQTPLYQKLTERSGADAKPWSLIIALHEWPATTAAVMQLAALTAIARTAGAALLSAASPAFVGAADFATTPKTEQWTEIPTDFQTAWDSLRASTLAANLGLALPRVLLRLPYGTADPIDSFNFDEQTTLPEHQHFLWGNPALACALVIGRRFLDDGWAITQRLSRDAQFDIDNMPAYSYKQEGETQLQAVAETYLSESAALKISQQGLIPILSFRHRNAIRVGGLYSCDKDRCGLLENV